MSDHIENIRRIASFLWEVAQDLHGAVAKSENQNIILLSPFSGGSIMVQRVLLNQKCLNLSNFFLAEGIFFH